ncbi:MAG: sodium:proton antiporter [Acidobacteriota bacterium]
MSSSTSSELAGVSRIRRASAEVSWAILIVVALYAVAVVTGWLPAPPQEQAATAQAASEAHEPFVPASWSVLPFVALLLAIAVLPLIESTKHWWESNRNRFILASVLALITLSYYGLIHPGGVEDHFTLTGASHPGWGTVGTVFSNAFFGEYIPFIVLLFSLYVISGGISLRGDLPAHPLVNCVFLGAGAASASFIGTTGAAMVFIRPLLSTNAERRYKVHTVLFFIFMVCNCGGLLLPIGDPPLFLGYLRGVPFTWTLRLWPYWLGVNGTLLVIYYIWDRIVYSREPIRGIVKDETEVRPLQLSGNVNFLLIFGVVLAVALLVPGEPMPGTSFITPLFFREIVMLLFVAASLRLTQPEARLWNRFDYHAIVEVAALFFGIFICMQAPIEILHVRGAALGISSAHSFFLATGTLSSFLDNAPTYVVFFETAVALPASGDAFLRLVGHQVIMDHHLIAISLGAVFMGANTYIGNGPNFMVKSIAEQTGVKMPSFFGYMGYALLILMPIWIVLSMII